MHFMYVIENLRKCLDAKSLAHCCLPEVTSTNWNVPCQHVLLLPYILAVLRKLSNKCGLLRQTTQEVCGSVLISEILQPHTPNMVICGSTKTTPRLQNMQYRTNAWNHSAYFHHLFTVNRFDMDPNLFETDTEKLIHISLWLPFSCTQTLFIFHYV